MLLQKLFVVRVHIYAKARFSFVPVGKENNDVSQLQ